MIVPRRILAAVSDWRPKVIIARRSDAWTMAPVHLDALNGRGDCLALLGRQEEAIAAYDKLLASRPHDTNARNSKASALKSAGRLDEAVAEYDEVVKVDPNHIEALF